MAPKPSTQPADTTATSGNATASGEIAPVAASAVLPAATPARTPEMVPVPGGGQWAWNADKLDWEDKNPKPATPADPLTAQAQTA